MDPFGGSETEFRGWLASKNTDDTQYIEERFDPAFGYNMGGHAYSAFNGLREFLRANPDLVPIMANATYIPRTFWDTYPGLTPRLRQFVIAEGYKFPGQNGGPWSNKLPTSLGGTSVMGGEEGGRGSGLIARMLIELSNFAIARGF